MTMRFHSIFDKLRIATRSRHLGLVLAALVAIATTLLAAASYGQSFTGRDPNTGEILAPGTAVGQYLQASQELGIRIQNLHAQLDRCGDCAERADLERELDDAVGQRNTLREGEKNALKTLGLPGDSFEDFLYRLRFGIQDRPLEGQVFDEQLRKTVINYCLITSKNDAENKACRTKYFNGQTRETAADVLKICYKGLDRKSQILLHNFPAPDADPAMIAKHQALWIGFQACVKRTNPYEMMRIATNEACSFQDLSANLTDQDFICACKGFSESRRAACPANSILPPPAIPTFEFQDEPVVRMLSPEGYGPTFMGVRLGMPLAAADVEIRKRMKVDSVYDLAVSKHQMFDASNPQSPGTEWPFRVGGRLYVDRDGTEFVAVLTAANLPGRVFELEHAALLPEEAEAAFETALKKELGQPVAKGYVPGDIHATTDIWGVNCRPLFFPGRLRMEDWRVLEGQPKIVSKTSPSPNWQVGYLLTYGLYGGMTPLMRTDPNVDDLSMYSCGPQLAAYFEDTGYRKVDKRHDWKDVPVLVDQWLVDPSMLRWYEIQESDYYDDAVLPPVAPYDGSLVR